MRKSIGLICVLLGVACLLSAGGMMLYNRWEDNNAAKLSQSMLEVVQALILENIEDLTDDSTDPDNNEYTDAPGISTEMMTVASDGYEYIGVLSVPVLHLELPVLTDWSYDKLKKAPCHYFGSCYEKDFVIAAHNYTSQFGKLPSLQEGDVVIFTDVKGTDHFYEVVLLETLPENATKEMITSGFDLSLYTCTMGGDSRVTVRCRAADNVQ